MHHTSIQRTAANTNKVICQDCAFSIDCQVYNHASIIAESHQWEAMRAAWAASFPPAA